MILSGYQVELHEVRQQDLEMIRAWRNDPAVSQFMLSQDMITAEQQQAWFTKVQRDPAQQHFVIYYKAVPIGAANIKARGVGTELTTASCIEPGLYIADSRYQGNIVAFAPTLLLNDYCFETLQVERLKAVVKADNQAALNYNKKLGYKVDKQDELIEISLNLEDYQHHTKQLKALLSRQSNRK